MSEAAREFLDTLAKVLLPCWILGFAMQLLVIGAVLVMGDTVHEWHGELFGLSIRESNLITASYAGLLKLCVGVLFFIPWLAIRFVLRKPKS